MAQPTHNSFICCQINQLCIIEIKEDEQLLNTILLLQGIRRRNLNQHLNEELLDHARLATRYTPNWIVQICNKIFQPPRQLTPQLTESVPGLGSSGYRDQRTELQDELKSKVS